MSSPPFTLLFAVVLPLPGVVPEFPRLRGPGPQLISSSSVFPFVRPFCFPRLLSISRLAVVAHSPEATAPYGMCLAAMLPAAAAAAAAIVLRLVASVAAPANSFAHRLLLLSFGMLPVVPESAAYCSHRLLPSAHVHTNFLLPQLEFQLKSPSLAPCCHEALLSRKYRYMHAFIHTSRYDIFIHIYTVTIMHKSVSQGKFIEKFRKNTVDTLRLPAHKCDW